MKIFGQNGVQVDKGSLKGLALVLSLGNSVLFVEKGGNNDEASMKRFVPDFSFFFFKKKTRSHTVTVFPFHFP